MTRRLCRAVAMIHCRGLGPAAAVMTQWLVLWQTLACRPFVPDGADSSLRLVSVCA